MNIGKIFYLTVNEVLVYNLKHAPAATHWGAGFLMKIVNCDSNSARGLLETQARSYHFFCIFYISLSCFYR
jgi:hypothetical protein